MTTKDEIKQQVEQGAPIPLPCGADLTIQVDNPLGGLVRVTIDGGGDFASTQRQADSKLKDAPNWEHSGVQMMVNEKNLPIIIGAFQAAQEIMNPPARLGPDLVTGKEPAYAADYAAEGNAHFTKLESDRIDWFKQHGFVINWAEREAERAKRMLDITPEKVEAMSDEEWAAFKESLPRVIPTDMRVQVSVYEVTRHCGGPEEGGWYYNRHQFEGVSERVYPEDIQAAKDRLLALYSDRQPEHDIYSVCNEHGQYEVSWELKCGDNDDTNRPRPHYE